MSAPFTNTGTTIDISVSAPVTKDKAGYDGLTWVRVRGVRLIGDIGIQYATSEYHAFGKHPTQKRYGIAAGSNNIELIKIDDAGQNIFRAAINGGAHSFKVTRPNGQTHYFTATVSALMEGIGDARAISDSKLTIHYTNPPI